VVAAQEHPEGPPSSAFPGSDAGIRSAAEAHAAATHGHPVLGSVPELLADAGFSGVDPASAARCADEDAAGEDATASTFPSTLQSTAASKPAPPPATVQLADALGDHSALVDRLRAFELVQLATIGISLAVTRPRSADRLDQLFTDDEEDAAVPGTPAAMLSPEPMPPTAASSPPSPPTAGSSTEGSSVNAVTAAAGLPALDDEERFLPRAEHLLEREHEAVLNVRLSARSGDSRRRLGLALTAFVGMPRLLRSLLIGRVRYNRWESLSRRLKHLPLAHLQALDVFLDGLDPRYSLGQFLRHAAAFLAQFETEPVLAARARTARDVWVEHLPEGLAVHCMRGPAAIIEAHYAKTRATAGAIVKNQLKSMSVTRTDTTGPSVDATRQTGTDAAPAGQTEMDAAPAEQTGTDREAGAADLPDLGDLTVTDERTLRQLMFDLLIGAQPQTQTTVERRTADGGDPERFRVDVVCPDDSTILRKQAAVVVTVPVTTLLGLDDRPGTVEGQPLPADMARSVAGSSKFWYRMLTDPATGRVLDDVAHRYEPDRATRLSVLGAWQACTLPGCSRPARECEIDHGIPFDHDHPERGGRTEPANLHPLCPAHHQAKTEGRITMRRTGHDRVEWVLPLGTTATTIAPRVDDGGILTVASAPTDTGTRRAASATIEERPVIDPLTNRRAASAVFEQAGREFLAEERAREEVLAARRREREPFFEEQRRMREWAKQTRTGLEEREERVRERENAVVHREQAVVRDEGLASLRHAKAEEKLDDVRRTAASLTGPPVRYRTVIPMRIRHVDLGGGTTGSVHSPVFLGRKPVGDDAAGARTGPGRFRSMVDDRMATAVHDWLARQTILVDWSDVDPDLIRNREPESGEGPQKPEPPPGSPPPADVDDDPPPF